MNLTHAPEIVSRCLTKAQQIESLERQVNHDYKVKGKRPSNATFNQPMDDFKALFVKVAELYPEYLPAIPKVHLPICKR
jgi:hypothetical protein